MRKISKNDVINNIAYKGYILYPIILCSICFYSNRKWQILDKINENTFNNIINISGVMVGFLITFIGILIAIPQETKVMRFIKAYSHDKIIIRSLFSAITMFILTIILIMFNFYIKYSIYTFLIGMVELCIVIYYLYHFVKNHFS